VLCFTTTTLFAQNTLSKSDVVKNNLRGHVKSVAETIYEDKHSGVQPAPNEILEVREMKFKLSGDLAESTLSSKILTNSGETFLYKVFKYDSTGHLIACTNTKEYGLNTVDSFECDNLGNIEIVIHYDPRNRIIGKEVYMYDEKNRELLKSDFDADSSDFILTSETETTYFDLERQRETKTRMPTGYFQDILTSLDEKGRIARVQLLDSAKNTTREWDWSFDKFDNMTNAEEWDRDKVLDYTRYTYEYDQFNNWVKRSEYKTGKPTRLTTRVLEYYQD
jgi:hypothetical protein